MTVICMRTREEKRKKKRIREWKVELVFNEEIIKTKLSRRMQGELHLGNF